ncbi:GNAT family N-acetyltransferase [Cyclobacterium sp.]|uniref:GNAT family N-acetyltransferase n=1 Tax=Cyclobacterium sp. TaxID=1966343 RepID=UPI0019B760F5|nr:GNAT family N-acetyltransferase [Cyclobacterium sp.]MBD3628530.1 GNAT family N-acetyltransferase [Cyclobacterium sp.]
MQHQNIFNLTELWKLGGLSSGKLVSEKGVFSGIASIGDWPNKLWVEGVLTPEKLEILNSIGKGKALSFALWEEGIQEELLTEIGFQPTMELIGMSGDLKNFSHSDQLDVILKKINTAEEAITWSRVFFDAFGYEILSPTVLALKEKVHFYTAWFKGKPIGTSMVFIDSAGIAGIYSIGIAPAFRGQGLASQLFKATLSEIKKTESIRAILQASAMGLGLYMKYGFHSDFKIRFYKR